MTIEWSEASSEVITIAEEIIKDYHPDLKEASIGFLFRSEAQLSGEMEVWGKASKVPVKLKPLLDFDFVIWIAEDAWKVFSLERKKALIDHELCHCSKIGGLVKMRHHDFEEFQCIIDRWGLWTSALFNARTVFKKAAQGSFFDDAQVTITSSDGKVATITGEQLAAAAKEIGR